MFARGKHQVRQRNVPAVVFVSAALMVCFTAATVCSNSEATTSEETIDSSQATSSSEATTAEGSATEVEAAVQSAMEKNDLKAVLVRVTQNGEEVATVARGESMTGVPATEEMHFRNGAVAISYLGTVLLQLDEEGVVDMDDTIDACCPSFLHPIR